MSTKERIKKFILEELIYDKQLSDVEDTDSLLESGLIDSLNIAELIIYLEKKFLIQISDLDMIPENFENIEAITSFVEKKAM